MLCLFKNSKVVRKFVKTYEKIIFEKLYSAAVQWSKKILPKKNDKQIVRKKVLKRMTVRTVKKSILAHLLRILQNCQSHFSFEKISG